MVKFKKYIVLSLVTIMIATNALIPQEAKATSVKANDSNEKLDTEWLEVSGILDRYPVTYTELPSISNTTSLTPDGPLMGNGTVLAFMGGDKNKQQIFISRSDAWEDSPVGGRDHHNTTYGRITYERLDTGSGSNVFRYDQSMKDGIVNAVSEKGFETKTWLSATQNLIVTEITNTTEANITVGVSAVAADKSYSGSSFNSAVDNDNQLITVTKHLVSNKYNDHVDISTALKVMGKEAVLSKVNEQTSMAKFDLTADETVTVIAAIEGGKSSTTSLDDAKQHILSINTKEKLQSIKEKHLEWWKNFWLKSFIKLDAESALFERVYYGQLYMMGASLDAQSDNNGGVLAGNQFPWTGNPNSNWQGDYAMNADMQRAPNAAIVANRLGYINNYTKLINDFWEVGRSLASDPKEMNYVINNSDWYPKFTKGVRGVLIPTHIAPWGRRTEHFNSSSDYFASIANASLGLVPMVRYWEYTGDDEYLKKELYSKLVDLTEFFEDYAILNPATGKYIIGGATVEGHHLQKNSFLDLASAYFAFEKAIKASESLGVDADKRAQWQQFYDKLSPLPTAVIPEGRPGAGKITFVAADGLKPDGQRFPIIHTTYLYDLVGMASDPKLLEYTKNYVEYVIPWQYDNDKEDRSAMIATNVGYDIKKITDFLTKGIIDRSVGDWTGIRNNNTVGGTVQSSLLYNNITHSLLQSNQDFIHVFANWHTDQKAEFTRLRAKGGFLVDANQNELGQTTYVNIFSEKGKALSVLNPWPGQEVEVYEDGARISATKSTNNLGDVYTVSTKANSSYELKPTGGLQKVTLVSITPPAAITDIEMGTAKTAEALALPSNVQLVTNQNKTKGVVVWDVTNASYDPARKGHQSFTVNGTVTLPDGIENPNAVSLSTRIKVNVNRIPQKQMIATATSEEAGKDVAFNAIDGNPQSIWHTKWNKSDALPQSITLNLGGTYDNINKVTVLPRPDGGNGNITGYNIYVSTDGTTFTKVATGSWANDATEKIATFTVTNASYVKLEATAGVSGWASAAEVNVFAESMKERQVVGITAPANMTGVANGTAKTAIALGLPATVEMVMDAGSMNANVTWNVQASSYDPTLKTAQTFIVNGTVTLPPGVTNPNHVSLATSISVTVSKASAVLNVNDNDPAISYTGSFSYSQNRGKGDYMNDVHQTQNNGDYFQFTFTGTGIDYIGAKNVDLGNQDVYIDGNLMQTVSGTASSYIPQSVLYSNKSLASGTHTIKVVKKSGYWLVFDALKVYQDSALSGITAPADITGLANGTAKTAVALGLPGQVVLVTNSGNVNADVTWNVDGSSYDPAQKTAQTFIVNGTVTLPEGVINPNNVALTTSIQVTVLQASTMPQSTLTGEHQVAPGQTFDVTMGLSNVTQSVYQQMYAQDLTLHYDPANVKFDSVTSLNDEFKVIEQKEMVPGYIRIVAASVGANQGVPAQGDLLKFKFTVKSDTKATDTTVSAGDVVIANSEGNELQVNGYSHKLQISTSVDKSLLNATIASAQTKHDAAVEGNGHGLYAVGSKAQLQSTINAAKATANDPNARQQQVDNAKSLLEAAIQVFESKKISADVNGKDGITIGDLAIVAAAYGKQEGQSGWNPKADVNKDGKIDIEDLAIVAKAILQ
ncbi:discoidin domain-containing protein [Paenibacillus sp. GCM10027629]|uniref:discoidin domain-containing protein n=1 Tax=Paenibacillus sp. GCM10027629 TaxID=3273414 RepID=UPI00362A18C5